MPSPPAAYDGLFELSNECWRCAAEAVYMASASVPRLPIVGNAPGVLDDIRYFLQNLLNLVSGYTISNWIRNTMLPLAIPYINLYLVEPFQHFISGIRNTFISAINWVATHIYDPLSWISSWLSTIRYNLSSWLVSAAKEGVSLLCNPLGNVVAGLNIIWQNIPSWIRDPLTGLGNQVWASISSVGTLIGGCVSALRTGLATVVSNAAETIRSELFWLRVAADWMRTSLPSHLSMIGVTAVTQFWNTIVAALHGLWLRSSTACADIVLAVIGVGTPILKNLWAGVSSLPSTYLSWLATTCGTDLALTPSRALASVGGLYSMAIIAGTTAMGISAALNLIPTLNWVGAAQLAGFVSEAAAFDPLTKATYGVLINDALTIPIRYHWNNVLRPSMPTIGEIYTMGRKHGLSMGEFQTAMGYQGIPNWWIEKIYDFFWTDPSPMWLLRMTEGGIPSITTAGRKGPWLDQWIPNWRSDPMAWLRMKLMLSGFEDIDIDPMIAGMRMRSVTGTVTGAKTAARAMMHEAYWTEADAKAFLTPLGVRPEEIHMLAVAEELDYQKSYLDDQVAYYVAAFAKGQISDQALNLALTTIYVKPARVAQVIARERIRKLPTPKSVTPVELNPNVTRLRTQAINSWIAQYHTWQISEDDLLLSLTIIVQDAALAKSMVAVEMTRFRPVPPAPKPPAEDPLLAASRRQAIATWIAAFRDGEISSDELEQYLVPLIADAALRKQLVALEKLRKPPKPKVIPPVKEDPAVTRLRTQAINSWIAQYHTWQISEADLLQSLTIIVQDAVLAREMVNAEMTRFRPVPPAPKPPAEDPLLAAARRQSIATWVAAFRDGKIISSELELYLEPLITDTVLRKQLVELEKLRYSPTPELIALATENDEMAKVRAEYVRGHIELFQKRLIGIEQLYQYLQVDGLAEPLARATAITQATKRIKMPAIDSPYYLQAQHAELIDVGLQMYEDSYMAGEITLAQYEAWLTTLAKDQDVVTYLADVLALRKFAGSL